MRLFEFCKVEISKFSELKIVLGAKNTGFQSLIKRYEEACQDLWRKIHPEILKSNIHINWKCHHVRTGIQNLLFKDGNTLPWEN